MKCYYVIFSKQYVDFELFVILNFVICYIMSRNKATTSDASNSKGISPLRLLLIGVVLFLMLSFALQTCGINIFMTTTNEEQLIDRPHSQERRTRDVPADLDVPEE
jgi:hypothetical protein